MVKIEKFEDLQVWQKSRKLTKEVYLVTRKEKFAKDFGLAAQIQRASVSIMSNIAEGYERKSTIEYLRYLDIAKASCAEVRAQLYVAYDIAYIDKQSFLNLRNQAQEISKMLSGLIKSLKASNFERN